MHARSPQVEFGKRSERKEKQVEKDLGPGSYELQTDFGIHDAGFTIGEKRPIQ